MNGSYQLSDQQRTVIAELQDRQPAHKISSRLGIPKSVVKAEVRRLRRALFEPESLPTPGPLSQPRLTALGLLCLALIPVAAGISAPSPKPPPEPTIPAESEEARELYRQADRGEAPVADELALKLESEDASLRLAAVRAYVQSPLPGRDPTPILPRLNDSEQRIRLATIQGLGALGGMCQAI